MEKKKKNPPPPDNLEHKLETCSEIPCSQVQKQLNAYYIFIKCLHQLQNQRMHILSQWKDDCKCVQSNSKDLCCAASGRVWRVHSLWRVNIVILWLAALVWLWQHALCDVPQGWILGISSCWDLHKRLRVLTWVCVWENTAKTLIAIETVPVLM